MSVILKPNLNREQLLPFSLVVACSVAKAIEIVTGIKVRTKWVNDLVVQRAKIGGILVETEGESEIPEFFIVGIGINVNQITFPLGEPITSLRLLTARKISRWQLIKAITQELEKDYELFQQEKFLALRQDYKRRCSILNKAVSVITGYNRILGKVIDIDENGRLILLTAGNEIKKIVSGQISIVEGHSQYVPERF